MLTTSRNANHVLVTVSDSNANITLKGSGELLKIVFRGRLRADTLCTTLLNAGITISNTDNLVASIAYGFKGICILGRHKKDTVTKEVRTDDWQSIAIKLTPNPASSFVNFQIPSEGSVKKHLVVSDGLGRIVLDKVLYSDFWWEVSSVPAGLYSATVFEDSLLKSSRSVKQSSKILIIH